MRQPRDGPMQCGSQPADISVIHRRFKLPRIALPRPATKPPRKKEILMRKSARSLRAALAKNGPYQLANSNLPGVTNKVTGAV